ncbi:DUF3800 domain-containing protein [Lactobacillus sp. LL6]|uniref:DUF3800 domain-containing protein n=1 Tax=Lactobacillus sp. LL6 TaxID=2596827 RepID=UPI001186C6CE|nr:DUF3800 domain-containing protein [Lactobacillus sp. LL6]TSO25272.1 DUF3800 domain-containing protein [Lactobacillus sp. LL6]
MAIKLLTTTLKQPLLLMRSEEYNIYIDESITYRHIDEHAFPEQFITAFCVIPVCNIKKFNKYYFQYVYKSRKGAEIKSTNVSDKENRNILKNSKKYLTKSLIFSRPAYMLDSFEHNKQALSLALDLRSYIAPVKRLVKAIKVDATTHYVKFNILIDQTSRNGINPYVSYSQELLGKMANEISTQNLKYIFTYHVLDSKQSYGIQLADMLAGAYRKECSYIKTNEKVKIIPFAYLLEKGPEKLKQDQIFLKLFGYVAYTRLLLGPDAEELPNLQYSQKWYYNIKSLRIKINRFYKRIIINHNLSSTISLAYRILTDCNNVTLSSKRKRILEEINMLNKTLKPLALINGLNANEFILQFSNKVKDKNYHKTIIQITTNIESVQKVVKKEEYDTFNRGLKYFNRNILQILNK